MRKSSLNNILVLSTLIGFCLLCSCRKETPTQEEASPSKEATIQNQKTKIRQPLEEVIKLETRHPVLLKVFPEGALSDEDREALLLYMKWSDLFELLDYPEYIKKIAIQYNNEITDKDLRFLKYFPNVEELFLKDSRNITDEGMLILKKLPRLTTLSVYGTQVTEASLPLITELNHLENLYFGALPENTHSSDPSESPWKDQEIHFTDISLKHLKKTQIKNLWFMSPTDITDEGLAYISSMQNLERISIMSDHITEEGAEKIIPSLPDKKMTISISAAPAGDGDGISPKIIKHKEITLILRGLK